MPYPGVPSSKTNKMEDCVSSVKASGKDVNAYAVCYASIMGGTKRAIKKRLKNKKS